MRIVSPSSSQHEVSVPHLEAQHRPQLSLEAGRLMAVSFDEALDSVLAQQIARCELASREVVVDDVAQRTAQPRTDRDIEAVLRLVDDPAGKERPDRGLEQ